MPDVFTGQEFAKSLSTGQLKKSIGSTGKLAVFAFFMVGAAGGLTFACGGNAAPAVDASGSDTSSGDSNTGDASNGSNGTIALSVTYNGTNITGTEPIIATVWVKDQAGSSPAPAGLGQNITASWPGTNVVDILDVAPGSYFVFTFIMVGSDHELGPIPGDADLYITGGVPVTVVAGQTVSASATVVDVPFLDAGT
jgi:hypothetical protein